MSDMHIGRNWVAPDPFAPGCGCAVLACGLVSARATGECDQHSVMAERTIRTMHRAEDCPIPVPDAPHGTKTRSAGSAA